MADLGGRRGGDGGEAAELTRAPGAPASGPAACDTILVSFPRSGANWVRHCAEAVSGRPTPGYRKLVGGTDYVFHRTHDVRVRYEGVDLEASFFDPDEAPRYRRALALVRDPKALLVREVIKHRRLADFDTALAQLEQLVVNLEAVERCCPELLVAHYEDLVADFGEMRRVLAFLGVTAPEDFDVDEARRRSTDWYDARHGAHTRADPLDFGHHTRDLTAEQRRRVDGWLQARAPDIYARHLARYAEPPA